MDPDWRFTAVDSEISDPHIKTHSAVYHSSKAGGATGPATKKAYDDSAWQRVNLPHDYLREAPFSPDAIGNHGYRTFCDGWYRKTFSLDESLRGKHAMLVFDGISTSSVVYLNGSILERSFSLYSEIALDVTDRLYYDRINTLAVHTKGGDIEGWWYEGAGIYRHVRLYFKELIHIAHNGLWAKPVLVDAETDTWRVDLETTVENSDYEDTAISVYAALYDGESLVAEVESDSTLCSKDGTTVIPTVLPVSAPNRWDVDAPHLYTLRVEVRRNGNTVDTDTARIGFRTFRVDAEKGFFLNERPLKLKGTCNHQDHAGVGVAVPDSVQYYRIRRLKEMGCNAYRCAHNPPSREILDACDEYGMIVMDECRTFETRPDAIRSLDTMIRRDRNHPSVIFYSLFNEEPLQNTSEGRAIYRRLRSYAEKLDTTRLFTGAINDNIHENGTGMEMDIMGLNYGIHRLPAIHKSYPDRPMTGSENCSAVTTRGCYVSDRENAHVLNNYDEEIVPWGHSVRDNWKMIMAHDYIVGSFDWTGFDYRGEPTPFTWPSCSSQFGIMDTCGFPKDSYYFHQAIFLSKPMLHILPHWNWEEGMTVRVMTVTNCDEVELFLNGASLGRRKNDVFEQQEWSVPFTVGTLSAVGYRNGKAVASAENKTAKDAKCVQLIPDRTYIENGGQDTVPVRVSVIDQNGIELPTASNLVRFEIIGDGIIAGVGNGDPNSHEADHLPERHLYCGLCQVLVTAKRGAKSLTLVAKADGLEEARVHFEIKEVTPDAAIFFRPNYAVTGILASVTDLEQKPDPAKTYGDDDMNSFAPMEIEKSLFSNFHPSNFLAGWREIRIPVSLPAVVPEGKLPVLEIASVICELAEFYVDGKLIYRESPAYKAAMTVPLDITNRKEFEVRCLLKASSHTAPNGFAQSLTLTLTERK